MGEVSGRSVSGGQGRGGPEFLDYIAHIIGGMIGNQTNLMSSQQLSPVAIF